MPRAQPRLWCVLILPHLACHNLLILVPIDPRTLKGPLRQPCRQGPNRHAMIHTQRFGLAISRFLPLGISCRLPVD